MIVRLVDKLESTGLIKNARFQNIVLSQNFPQNLWGFITLILSAGDFSYPYLLTPPTFELGAMANQIRERKVLDTLLDQAKISEAKPASKDKKSPQEKTAKPRKKTSKSTAAGKAKSKKEKSSS